MSTLTMTDTELQQQVLKEMKWEPSVNAAHIGVSVKDGVVTLSGHVSSEPGDIGVRRGYDPSQELIYCLVKLSSKHVLHEEPK